MTAQLSDIAPEKGPSMSPLELRNAIFVLPQAVIFAQTLRSYIFLFGSLGATKPGKGSDPISRLGKGSDPISPALDALAAQTLGVVPGQYLRIIPIQHAQHHRLLLTAIQRFACTLTRRDADIAHLPGLQRALLGFGEIDLVDHIDQDIGLPGGDPRPLDRQVRQTRILRLDANVN